jgi:hypothetical protein
MNVLNVEMAAKPTQQRPPPAAEQFSYETLTLIHQRVGSTAEQQLRPRGPLHGRPYFRACVSIASFALPGHGKSSVGFGPYRKANPQSAEDHIRDPGRHQMSGCRNYYNYSDQQGHIGPLDVIFGGHATRPYFLCGLDLGLSLLSIIRRVRSRRKEQRT